MGPRHDINVILFPIRTEKMSARQEESATNIARTKATSKENLSEFTLFLVFKNKTIELNSNNLLCFL